MTDSVLALSFDDGPDDATSAILDLLARYDAHATFFVLGRQVRGREEILVRMLNEGHELGNHTFNHVRISDATAEEIEDELTRTSQEIERATGVTPSLMRPPFGIGGKRAAPIARRLGLEVVVWTRNSEDWRGEPSATVVSRLLQARPGEVVVLHDGLAEGGSRRETVRALEVAIPAWVDQGLRIVNVGELFRMRPWSGRRRVVVETSRIRTAVRLTTCSVRAALGARRGDRH